MPGPETYQNHDYVLIKDALLTEDFNDTTSDDLYPNGLDVRTYKSALFMWTWACSSNSAAPYIQIGNIGQDHNYYAMGNTTVGSSINTLNDGEILWDGTFSASTIYRKAESVAFPNLETLKVKAKATNDEGGALTLTVNLTSL